MTEPIDLPPVEPTWPKESAWGNESVASTYVDPGAAHRRPAGLVALAVTVVALLVAGVAAVSALTAPVANTPQAAVSELLKAAANSDVLGVLDNVAPAERDILSGFLTDGVSDLKRLGVLAPGTDLHRVAGVSLSFDNVTMTEAPVREDLAAVTITGGTLHHHVDPSQVPLGPFVHQHAASSLAKARVSDSTQPIHVTTPIVAVRQSGRWYVSLAYTIAEAARRRSGSALPTTGVPAAGADGPTQAVDQFLRAAAVLDVRRLIELTPPDEMAALHEYAPLFLAKLDDAIARLKAGPHAPTVTITDLTLTSDAHRGGRLVKIAKLGVSITSGGTTIKVTPGTKCVQVTSTDATPPVFPGQCGTHAPFGAWSSSSSSTTCTGAASGTAIAASPTSPAPPTGELCSSTPPAPTSATMTSPYAGLKALSGLRFDVGIVVVQREGKWYVSPLRTGFDDLEAVLHALTPEILQSVTSATNPLSLLGLPLGLAAASATRSSSAWGSWITSPSPISSSPGTGFFRGGAPNSGVTAAPAAIGQCLNGKVTITFAAPPGGSPRPPVTFPCPTKTTP